jgi:hypothetical protein
MKMLRVATVASVAIVLIGFASQAHAAPPLQTGPLVSYADAVPGLAPADIGNSARYVDKNGRVIGTTPSAGVVTSLLGCQPISYPDYPHYSAPDVSAHGLWDKGTCTANTAHVQNCLYEYYTDATWRRKACSQKLQLKPKAVSNNRVTARRQCDSTGQSISWRNHVDVDVDGQIDNSDVPYKQQNVNCVVAGPDQ